MSTIKILERFKAAFGLKNDAALSRFLGVKANTISTWKANGTGDYKLIISKCRNVNLNWLFFGEGTPDYSIPDFTHEELELIKLYREASPEGKAMILAALKSVSPISANRLWP